MGSARENHAVVEAIIAPSLHLWGVPIIFYAAHASLIDVLHTHCSLPHREDKAAVRTAELKALKAIVDKVYCLDLLSSLSLSLSQLQS